MSSQERFGYEWDKYSHMDENYEHQFKNWVSPLRPEDFQGKKILDAGCGMGRNSYWPLKWGAKGVTAFDFDKRSVERAKQTLSSFKNVEVFYKSIFKIDWKNEFDIAMSIGVIHHLEDPLLALQNMTRALVPGGTLLVWVYSYEGNEWIVRYVNPVRKHITSKLPVSVVHFLSYFCSVPLFLFVKIFKGPSGYLKQLSTFDFWHIHSIVFDQLIPDIANYWSKKDLEEMLGKITDIENLSIQPPPNGSGWIIQAKKK
jgi:SAM-dependent methyltransferase